MHSIMLCLCSRQSWGGRPRLIYRCIALLLSPSRTPWKAYVPGLPDQLLHFLRRLLTSLHLAVRQPSSITLHSTSPSRMFAARREKPHTRTLGTPLPHKHVHTCSRQDGRRT